MAFPIDIGSAAQPDTGFSIVIGNDGGSMLDFELPALIPGTVMAIAIVRNAEVLCSDNTWTKAVDGVGASSIFLDVYTRTVDGTTGSNEGDVISFVSLTSQDLQGALVTVTSAVENGLVYDVQHAAFAADTSPTAAEVTALQELDAVLCIFSTDATTTLTAPSGFTALDTYSSSTPVRSFLACRRAADSTGTIAPGDATASPAATGRTFTLALFHAAPGATIDRLNTGSLARKWVASIEGYPYLLTDADEHQAAAAYDGTDYTSAIPALYVDLQNEQTIDPWSPFTKGGRLTLRVVDTADDTFGIDVHRKAGAETFLAVPLEASGDTVITVKSNDAFTETGTAYIGTEAITYSARQSTPERLTIASRGKYSPLLTDAGANYAHQHAIPAGDPLGFSVPPVVSQQPRHWVGKWVALRMHLWDAANGLLNTRDDARLVFAGKIDGIRDNPDGMTTDVDVKHVNDIIAERVLGVGLWTAKIADGITLETGQVFGASDRFFDGSTMDISTASPLVVKASGASGAYEIDAGRYTLGQLLSRIDAWLAQALDDADLRGSFHVGITSVEGVTHGKLVMTPGGTGDQCVFQISMPRSVFIALGQFADASGAVFGNATLTRDGLTAGDTVRETSLGPAMRIVGANNVEVYDESGIFTDQYAALPINHKAVLGPQAIGDDYGYILLNGKQPCLVQKLEDDADPATPGVLVRCRPFDPVTGQLLDPQMITVEFDKPGDATITQFYAFVDTLANHLKKMAYSSGVAGYNHATYDAYPEPMSIGLPGELLGDDFEESCDALPSSDMIIPLIVTKPTKLADVIGGDLKLRFAFLRWVNEHLEWWSWMTPFTGIALTESNKAHPAGVNDEQRSSTVLYDDWQRNVIKLEFNRDFTISDTNAAYRDHITVVDRVAIDDAGGTQRVETIRAPNTYSQSYLGAGGTGIEDLTPRFKSVASLFTRPVRRTRRTIDPRYWEQIAVGDVVLVTDAFARDPDTGQRSVATRPGIIVSHRWNPGGLEPGSDTPRDMDGEVEILFLDLLRTGPYVPCANVDDGAANGGLDAGTETIFTCEAHDYSESSEAADASYMTAGRKIRIVERDPADPAAPLSWDRVVDSQTGNTVTVTVAISLPAWDSGKKYRIIWDDYPDAIANQQTFSYQADDADGMVSDSRAPFQYVIGGYKQSWPLVLATANAATDPVELPPDSVYGDGVGVDVGTMYALNRLVNNLIDYKTARSNPWMLNTDFEASGDTNSDEWVLCAILPINLGWVQLANGISRSLYVAPLVKSSDGDEVLTRITLTPYPPTGDSRVEVDRGLFYDEVEFSTTSTTYAVPTAQQLSLAGRTNMQGNAYLLIEMKVPAAAGSTIATSRGLAVCYEGPRTT